jgi:signal transduction histidine kinase
LNSIINVPAGLLDRFSQVRAAQCSKCRAPFELEPGEVLQSGAPCPNCKTSEALAEHVAWRYRGDLGVVVDNLRRVHRSGSSLLSLIEQILDFSQLETGGARLKLDAVVVTKVIEECLALLEPLASQRGVGLRPEFASSPTITADRIKLLQILMNLVGNAIKFSPDGSDVTVTVSESGSDCTIRVTDRGAGIAPEHHQTIFESFRQIDGGSTRRHGGVGLGLAISKRYVTLHEGSIGLESSLGQGSSFLVRLPISGPSQYPL